MKTLPLLATILFGSLSLTSHAQAGVGKLAGTFTGQGKLLDKSNAALSIYYHYDFKSLKVIVKGSGAISGSSTVAVTSALDPKGPFLPVTTQAVTVSGKAKVTSKTKKKITATARLNFSNGYGSVDVKFDVAAKTGKGTFKGKVKNAKVEAEFEGSKK